MIDLRILSLGPTILSLGPAILSLGPTTLSLGSNYFVKKLNLLFLVRKLTFGKSP